MAAGPLATDLRFAKFDVVILPGHTRYQAAWMFARLA
jgi:hypothetical protein